MMQNCFHMVLTSIFIVDVFFFFFLTGEYMLLLVNKFQFKITSPLDFLTCEDLCVSLVAGEMFS